MLSLSLSHRLRPIFVSFVCFVGSLSLPLPASAASTTSASTEFIRVWPGWRDADSFERIGEYFGQPENTGGELVLRTQSTSRDGYYFLVRVKSSEAAAAARFELQVIRPDSPETKTFTFPAQLPKPETVFQLGVTGPDWPGGKPAHPVAWRLALLSADGRLLAEHKSFLWEKPAK